MTKTMTSVPQEGLVELTKQKAAQKQLHPKGCYLYCQTYALIFVHTEQPLDIVF